MPSKAIPPASPHPDSAWHRFHEAVLGDDTLLSHLLATPNATAFRETVLALATKHGLVLSPEELDAAIEGVRHAWLVRQVMP